MHSGQKLKNLKKKKKQEKSGTGVLQPNVSSLEYNPLNYFLFLK